MKKTTSIAKSDSKRFSIDARAMLTWGRDSIKDHSTAVLELVKNSYDAGSTVVVVTITSQTSSRASTMIRISDNGSGMSNEDVSTKWLRIGFSEKRSNKTVRGRRKSGEKGIGRISADRLGSILELRTQSSNDEPVGLEIDWNLFERGGIDLNSIELQSLDDSTFLVPNRASFNDKTNNYLEPSEPQQNSRQVTGTELTIRKLRQKWTRSDIEDLRNELSILTSPLKKADDFQVRIENDLDPSISGVVISPFYASAQIEATFDYRGDDSVTYKFRDRESTGKLKESDKGTVPWDRFVHLPPDFQDAYGSTSPKKLGPVSMHLLFYLREAESIKGTDFSIADLRDFLNINAGIKVYRDNIRVIPYGDPRKPEGDWLGLGPRKASEPAGPSRPTWKVSPTQLIGHVFLSRDINPDISDTSGREGLIHGEAFVLLKALIFGCLLRLEAHYHRLFVQRLESQPPTPSPRETLRAFGDELSTLKQDLKDVEHKLPKQAARATANLRTQLEQTISRASTLRSSIDALATQATIYRGLATLGIAVATFGHEVESSLEQFISSAYATSSLLKQKPAALHEALDELQKSINAGERVGAWGAYALRRVNSSKRKLRDIDVNDLLDKLLKELKPAFEASSIKVVAKFSPVTAKVFPMDIESIFVNLMTNAYFFCKVSKKKRVVFTSLRSKAVAGHRGFELIVSDSGPGVDASIVDQIWEPLFSSKVDRDGKSIGTGLGLSIVDSAIKDASGSRQVLRDAELGGSKFSVWIKSSD